MTTAALATFVRDYAGAGASVDTRLPRGAGPCGTVLVPATGAGCTAPSRRAGRRRHCARSLVPQPATSHRRAARAPSVTGSAHRCHHLPTESEHPWPAYRSRQGLTAAVPLRATPAAARRSAPVRSPGLLDKWKAAARLTTCPQALRRRTPQQPRGAHCQTRPTSRCSSSTPVLPSCLRQASPTRQSSTTPPAPRGRAGRRSPGQAGHFGVTCVHSAPTACQPGVRHPADRVGTRKRRKPARPRAPPRSHTGGGSPTSGRGKFFRPCFPCEPSRPHPTRSRGGRFR
jgi:hypothetical protein